MAHKIKYHSVEIPELDSFLADYAALCKRHGMRFEVDDYGYDGGHYITIHAADDDELYLNLDYADEAVPCIARARAAVEKIWEAERRAAEARESAELTAYNENMIRDGITVAGKRYKLVDPNQ